MNTNTAGEKASNDLNNKDDETFFQCKNHL